MLRYWPRVDECGDSGLRSIKARTLRLDDTQGIFLLLFFGVILATGTLFVEIALAGFSGWRENAAAVQKDALIRDSFNSSGRNPSKMMRWR